MKGPLLLVALVLLGQDGPAGALRPAPVNTLYFFFSPQTRGEDLARRVIPFLKEKKGAIQLRPVLLVREFGTVEKVQEDSSFIRTLKEFSKLGDRELDIPLYDEEGLALAEAWKITRLPTLVLGSPPQPPAPGRPPGPVRKAQLYAGGLLGSFPVTIVYPILLKSSSNVSTSWSPARFITAKETTSVKESS